MKPMTFLPKGGKPKNVCISLSCLRFHTGSSWISQVNVVFSPVLGAVSLATGCPKLIASHKSPGIVSDRVDPEVFFYSDPWLEHFFPGLNCLCGHPRFKFRFNIW